MTANPLPHFPCPHCSHTKSTVVDARGASDQSYIRRRRECPHCAERFTTFEISAQRYEELTVEGKEVNQFERAVDKLSKLAAQLRNGGVR